MNHFNHAQWKALSINTLGLDGQALPAGHACASALLHREGMLQPMPQDDNNAQGGHHEKGEHYRYSTQKSVANGNLFSKMSSLCCLLVKYYIMLQM